MEQLLTFINLATDVAAMTAAVATLTDIVLRHRNGGRPAESENAAKLRLASVPGRSSADRPSGIRARLFPR